MVIAIIAVLSTLLIPAVSGALERAHKMTCQSNMRQLAIFVRSYSIDHDGFGPPAGWFEGHYRNGFASRIMKYADPEIYGTITDRKSAQHVYAVAGKLFTCPSNKAGREDFSKSYLAVGGILGSLSSPPDNWQQHGGHLLRPRALALVSAPSRSFLFVENWLYYLSSPPPKHRSIWDAVNDVKLNADNHFLNFPAHGKGNIDRHKRRHDPNGHDYGRHYVHVDGHISFHVLEPGTAEDEKVYYFGL